MISGMARTSPSVELSAADQTRLQQWQSAHGTPQQVALRCRLVLAAAAGQQDLAIASACGVNRHTAALWRGRGLGAGVDPGWGAQAGRGRKPQYDLSQRDALIAATLQTKPKGMTHWSCRLMAKAQGVSKNTVNRLWQLHNLKPHLSRTFKLSRDSKFVEKLTDVVGLYLNPPQKALVLCVDEKSQIQALDRTQPGLQSWRTSSVRSSGLGPNWSPSSLVARSPGAKNGKSDMSSYLRDTTLVLLQSQSIL